MRQRAVLEFGDDLLDDGVVAVSGFCVQHRAVGEHGVVAVDREQLALLGGLSGRHVFHVEPADSAHDQPGGDLLAATTAGERGEPDLGDLGVGDPPLLVLVVDRVRILDRGPGLLLDVGDRFDHGVPAFRVIRLV